MNITTKLNDPIADFKLVDAYFRWTLLAIVEVAGEHGLDSVLQKVGMERFRQSYGSDKLEPASGLTFRDYANVNAGALEVLDSKVPGNVFHSGRVSARHAMRKNGEMFPLTPELADKTIAEEGKLLASLDTILKGYQGVAAQSGQHYNAWLEETETHFYYHLESCAVCAGKEAEEPICLFFSGSLMESIKWLTGRKYNVREVECRALDAPACVWEIKKSPVE